MNFLKQKTTWTNTELIPLKICIASAYVLVGAYFHDFIRKYYLVFIVLFGITVIVSLYKRFNKMKQENSK